MEFLSEKDQLKNLIAQRQSLEAEADAIFSELTSKGPNGEPPAGIKTPLVDSEGFPRNDIDLVNATSKRGRLAVINNDYKVLMSKIEELLHRIHG